MALLDKTLWLQADGAGRPGCGHCVSTPTGALCVGHYGAPCAHPRLEGDAQTLARVLQVLRTVADTEGNLVDTRRFSALCIGADEAELTLTFARACSPSRVLADDAFQALRRALPDTDVYVRLAG